MSFQPIQFRYTPPKTVQSLLSTPAQSGQVLTTTPLDPEIVASQSRAAALLGKLAALKATSQYLQELVKQLCSGMGAAMNYAGDPELAESLKRLYNTDTAPPAISVAMYSHLVAAEYGILRTDIVLANSNSTLQVSPYQRADLQRATKTFEDSMASTGDFENQLPLLLREFQGHDLVYDALTQSLQSYPVLDGTSYDAPESATEPPAGNYLNPQASDSFGAFAELGASVGSFSGSFDVGVDLSESLDQRLDDYQALYGRAYNVVSSVTGVLGAVNYDMAQVSQVATAAALESVDTVLALMAAYKTIQALFHKPKLSAIKDTLTMMLVPRLVAELGPYTCLLDRLVQRVTAPVTMLLRKADIALGELAGIEQNIAYLVSPKGLTGVVKAHIKKKPAPELQNNNEFTRALDQADKGIQQLIGYAGWGVKEIDAKSAELQKTLMQAMDRSQQSSKDRLETLESLKQLSNLLAVVENVILQTQGRSSTASQVINGVGSSLANLPVPDPGVQTSLLAGGATLLHPPALRPLTF